MLLKEDRIYHLPYSAEQIAAAVGKTPVIMDDGKGNKTWWLWDIASMAYEDTGMIASLGGPFAPLDEGGQVPDGNIGDNIPRLRAIASRLRDPAKPDYGLGGGAAEADAVLILRDYTGTADATAVVSGQEYDALNISTGGDAIPDGTIIFEQEE